MLESFTVKLKRNAKKKKVASSVGEEAVLSSERKTEEVEQQKSPRHFCPKTRQIYRWKTTRIKKCFFSRITFSGFEWR